jgi:hypothetical protein
MHAITVEGRTSVTGTIAGPIAAIVVLTARVKPTATLSGRGSAAGTATRFGGARILIADAANCAMLSF